MLAAFLSSRFSFHSLPLIKSIRWLVPVGVELTIRQVTDYIGRLDLKSSVFLPLSRQGTRPLCSRNKHVFLLRRDLSRYVFAKECAIRIDKQQKERYNNVVIDNDVII